MGIKTATINEAEAIHRIHDEAVRQTCKDFYTKKQIEVWLAGRSAEKYYEKINRGEMFVAENDGKIIGYVSCNSGRNCCRFCRSNFSRQGNW